MSEHPPVVETTEDAEAQAIFAAMDAMTVEKRDTSEQVISELIAYFGAQQFGYGRHVGTMSEMQLLCPVIESIARKGFEQAKEYMLQHAITDAEAEEARAQEAKKNQPNQPPEQQPSPPEKTEYEDILINPSIATNQASPDIPVSTSIGITASPVATHETQPNESTANDLDGVTLSATEPKMHDDGGVVAVIDDQPEPIVEITHSERITAPIADAAAEHDGVSDSPVPRVEDAVDIVPEVTGESSGSDSIPTHEAARDVAASAEVLLAEIIEPEISTPTPLSLPAQSVEKPIPNVIDMQEYVSRAEFSLENNHIQGDIDAFHIPQMAILDDELVIPTDITVGKAEIAIVENNVDSLVDDDGEGVLESNHTEVAVIDDFDYEMPTAQGGIEPEVRIDESEEVVDMPVSLQAVMERAADDVGDEEMEIEEQIDETKALMLSVDETLTDLVGEVPPYEEGYSITMMRRHAEDADIASAALERATTAIECQERLAELRSELTALLMLAGYENADEVAASLIERYGHDIKTLRHYITQLVLQLTPLEGAIQVSGTASSTTRHHRFGQGVLKMLATSLFHRDYQMLS